MVAEMLFDYQLSGRRQRTRPNRQAGNERSPGVGDTDRPAEKSAPVNADADVGLVAHLDHRLAG
ncbi:hypothetical protein ACRS5S_24830 [Nocardia asiatica]|uniref:hypothetical protein n=1 Tax=Nocardia asiatica TaxID=209252 RepID=UPI00245678F5|nr:hypothetical protein [Nocardia asiatica]